MPRYAALLRGVSPTNLSMPALARCLEAAGFTDVETVLASGNAVFSARAAPDRALERKVESAMARVLGRTFYTIVRPIDALAELVAADPFRGLRVPAGAKRVVSFLRAAPDRPPRLPIEQDGARIYALRGREALTAYVTTPRGPVFMTLIEKTFGKEVTTRTLDTVTRLARR